MSQFPHFLLLTLILVVGHTNAQTVLTGVECTAKLFSPRSDVASVYDGVDTIYIFGGWFYDPSDTLIPYADIHAYNITSDTISVVGQLPRTSWSGGAWYDQPTGDIFMLRGDGTFLWQYTPSTGVTISHGEWLGDSSTVTLVRTWNNKIFAFGGLTDPTAVYEYDIRTGVQGLLGTLPAPSELSVGIYAPELESTFLFGGLMGTWAPSLMVHNHSINATTTRATPTFPSFRHGDGSLTWDGEFAYIAGAVVDNGARGNGIIKFNLDSIEAEFIPVNGLADQLTATSTVFVPGLNRIYIIGGYDLRNLDTDQIWYVDLDQAKTK